MVLRGGDRLGPVGSRPPRRAGPAGAALAGSSPCTSSLRYGPLPTWARAGFHPADTPMPYVLGAKGDIVAILWARSFAFDGAAAPRSEQQDPVGVPGSPQRHLQPGDIARRLAGTRPVGAVQRRVVMGGPGPSGIDMPVRGCWQFSLTWSGHHDAVDLAYSGS